MKIACGHRASSPFPEKTLTAVRAELREVLRARGLGDWRPRPEDRKQSFDVRLIGGLARACRDLDWALTELWARGVWVGSKDRPLPRTPSVFARKLKRKLGELDPHAPPVLA